MTETAPTPRGLVITRATLIAAAVALVLAAVIVLALAIRYTVNPAHSAAVEACNAVATEPFAVDQVQTTEQMIDEIFADESADEREDKAATLTLTGFLEQGGYPLWVFGDLGHQKVVCLVPMSEDGTADVPQFIEASVLSQL